MPNKQIPDNEEKVFNFQRNSDGFHHIESDGTLVFVDKNVPREYFDEKENKKRIGILVEASKTNYLRNSTSPKSQTVSLGEGTYTFYAIGTGGVNISYGDAGTTYTGNPVTFTLSSPSDVTLTIDTGADLEAFQLEDGLSPTSIIKTSQNGSQTRESDILSHARGAFFSRNSGTFIGQFHVRDIEEGAVYFSVKTEEGNTFKIIGGNGADSVLDFYFDDNPPIQFLSPLVDGVVRFAIVYYTREGYVRCYLNDEVGELSIPYLKPVEVNWGDEPRPSRMVVSRYEYRPRAMNNTEVSRYFDHDYELAYDFEVTPLEVSDWADRILSASLFGLPM